MKLIDLTHVLQHQVPVYPGDSEMELVQTKYLSRDGYCNHQLTMNMHTGTHIDGPMHLIESDLYLSDFPLDSFVGKGTLLDVSGMNRIEYKEEYEHLIGEGTILILYTGFSVYFGQEKYFTEHPIITKEFAELVVRKKIKLIGMDTPSPDRYPFETHKLWFDNQVLIAENLTNVDRLLDVSSFEIIALPLLIKADSSAARIIARTE
ncbi:cyclase family protein [Paenibacillus sp. UMB4589-SE434]|uniref:cyclase family protein n=1 Tax=Paenibacillus sp. UMB4589-SE434 TaxID=3046314 RepID=UPI00254B17FC|nr:cyclase family protein [Paenibacillus sp. UMB4589-SE434]MDK8179604.1 cyclase family protein [Paenibacillus sp. UMB4589-SE434]